MWFLQIDVLLIMLLSCFLAAFIFRFKSFSPSMALLPVIDLAIIFYVSEKLAAFYFLYTLTTYVFLLLLRRIKKIRKFAFFVLILLCILPLIYFRFETILNLPTMGILLIGVAYNMLKAIDALYYEYYTDNKIEFIMYVNYIMFFPVITAGPVFRYRDFEKTWKNPIGFDLDNVTKGTKRIIRGLFKKIVLSFIASSVMMYLVKTELRWYISAIIPMLSWCVLYLDMSGYSDIAIGMGNIIGITIPENFKKPLQAPTFTQFWRNWHVSFSDWIREHVFVLFSGKILNKYQLAGISFTVMLLMSLWHGFSMLFVIDGIILGTIIGSESLLGITTVNKRKTNPYIFHIRAFATNYIFALNSLIFTLTVSQIEMVLKGFLIV